VESKLIGFRDFVDPCVKQDFDVGGSAFLLEHGDDVIRRAIAEQLAELFFVVWDAVLFDQFQESIGAVTSKGRFGEVGIPGDEVVRAGVKIGEIAAAAAGDENLLPMRSACSMTRTRLPRLPASMAHIRPAAPAPRMMALYA